MATVSVKENTQPEHQDIRAPESKVIEMCRDTAKLWARDKIRFHHFSCFVTGRLAGTIATREIDKHLVEVAATIVSAEQGKKNDEIAPSRQHGREWSLARLLNGNKKGRVIAAWAARKALHQKPTRDDYRNPNRISPSDIKVVLFDHELLKEAIRTRTVFDYFPGGKFVPHLRGPKPYRPRKKKTLVGKLKAFLRSFS